MESEFSKLYKNLGAKQGSGDKHAAFLNWYKKNAASQQEMTPQEKIFLLKKRIAELKKQAWLEKIPEERMPNAY